MSHETAIATALIHLAADAANLTERQRLAVRTLASTKASVREIEENIARVCHQVNQAYCEAMGDWSQPNWENAPDWQRESAMDGVRSHLHNPVLTPEQSHANWMAHKIQDGWVYGEVKDPHKKTHPCMVDYQDLPPEQRAKDYLFRACVHAMAHFISDSLAAQVEG